MQCIMGRCQFMVARCCCGITKGDPRQEKDRRWRCIAVQVDGRAHDDGMPQSSSLSATGQVTHLTQTDPSEATRKHPRCAGGCRAPHVPRRMIAKGPLTTAWHSRMTKSMLAIPIMVLTMLTGLPCNLPIQMTCHILLVI